MSKLSCEVIRDLFPSYIDGLTSEASNQEIEAHLQECEECRQLLASMKGGEEAFAPEESEKKEIDFLKKNKKRNLMIILFSILGAVLLALLVIALRFFFIGEKYDILPIVGVSGKKLTVKYITAEESATTVAGFRFVEKDGVVTVSARKVLVSPFHKGNVEETYWASEEIKQVVASGYILWDDGAKIGTGPARLYNTQHAYVGDMPANQRTASALNIWDVMGTYSNQLETAEEPYGWKITFQYDFSLESDLRNEDSLRSLSYMMMAVIGNLDRVTFSYTLNNESKECTFTREEADAFFGRPVKDCMESPRLLEELDQKTGWYRILFTRRIRSTLPPWYLTPDTIYPEVP